MEHRKAPTSTITMIDASNNNNSHHHHHHHNQKKRRTAKRQQLLSSSLTPKNPHVSPVIITDSNLNSQKVYVCEPEEEEYIPMKNPLAWTKKWTKWFSSCGSERVAEHTVVNPIIIPKRVSSYLFIIFKHLHLLCD